MKNLLPYFHATTCITLLGTYTANLCSQQLPEPYCSIKLLPFNGQGWYGNARHITPLFAQRAQTGLPIRIALEVGSWIGASTRHIASLLPEDGKLYAVDHWLGSVEHQPGGSAWTSSLAHLFQQFLSNVVHARLAHKIVPIRMTSIEAAKALSVQADFIYIDGGHETKTVYEDLAAWYPHLAPNGIFCGDDWNWQTVAAAVRRFAQERNLTIKSNDNFWLLERN